MDFFCPKLTSITMYYRQELGERRKARAHCSVLCIQLAINPFLKLQLWCGERQQIRRTPAVALSHWRLIGLLASTPVAGASADTHLSNNSGMGPIILS